MGDKFYAYHITPLDSGWEHLRTVRETFMDLQEDAEYGVCSLWDFMNSWMDAGLAAIKLGWEGDFRNEPCVFWVPGNDTVLIHGFVFKQDNNGSTFVISPVPMPHLEEDSWNHLFTGRGK